MEGVVSILNFEEEGGKARAINSPRTLEACLKTGIDPSELVRKCKKRFMSKSLTEEMIEKKYAAFERKRQEKIEMVTKAREKVVAENKHKAADGGGGLDLVAMMEEEARARSEAMMAAELARVEGLRRRQEKEIEQMVEKEKAVVEIQRKIQKAENDALKKEKERLKLVAKAKEAAAKKQVKFLQDKAEKERQAEEKRKEMMRKEEEVKKKLDRERKKEMKRLAAAARQAEAETKAKQEAKRQKTEALLKEQSDQAERNRLAMIEKERKVREQLAEKKAQMARESQAKKDAAEKRIAEAMEKHHELHEKKKRDFDEREAAAMTRYKEKLKEEKIKLHKTMQAREKKENVRIQRLVDAYQNRASHREEIVSRRTEKDQVYGVIQREREAVLAMKKFESELKMSEKLSNIERQARVNEFQRISTLGKIYEEDMKYATIKKAKQDLLAKQREEQRDNLNRKHEIADAMELMKITNDTSILQKVFEKQKRENAKKNKTRVDTSGGQGMDEEDDRLANTI